MSRDSSNDIRIFQGKYRINPNVFACCKLEVLEANDREMHVLATQKQRGDTHLPVGSKLWLINPEHTPHSQGPIQNIAITILEIREKDGHPLLICSPIEITPLSERRAITRMPLNLPIRLKGSNAAFTAIDGSINGMALRCETQKALLSLLLGHQYDFLMSHKGKEYTFTGQIKHLQYNWKTFHHQFGIQFQNLDAEQLVVLNVLIDPNYTVQITDTQTVDTSQGKISAD